MKVIVAGLPKTGTKSINAALKKLGYEVYDFVEHMYCLEKQWAEVFRNGWTDDTFYDMYKDIDAGVDMPASCFWEEIHRAFPDSKIILSVRDSEDAWFKSLRNHFRRLDDNILARICQFIELILQRDTGLLLNQSYEYFLNIKRALIGRTVINESILKKKYRDHNEYVKQHAPQDKLLVFNCKQGWEPLCRFLEAPIPNEPFPHQNINASVIEETIEHPLGKIYQKEIAMSFFLLIFKLFVVIAIFVYLIALFI